MTEQLKIIANPEHPANDIYALTGWADGKNVHHGGDGVPRLIRIGGAWTLWLLVTRETDGETVLTSRDLPRGLTDEEARRIAQRYLELLAEEGALP